MNYYIAKDRFSNYDLCHYGIQGMRWGVRRYQNSDGTLTKAGQRRYYKQIKSVNSQKDDPRKDPEVSDEVAARVFREVKKHSDIFNETEAAYDEETKAYLSFCNNKELVQKYILEAYDQGIPFADRYDLEEVNGDVTESLKKLWTNNNAAETAYYLYINGEGKNDAQKRIARINKAVQAQLEFSKKLTEDLLGKYAYRPIKTANIIKYKPNGSLAYMRIYPTAASVLTSEINRQARKVKYS